jgi:hypothetical protein
MYDYLMVASELFTSAFAYDARTKDKNVMKYTFVINKKIVCDNT